MPNENKPKADTDAQIRELVEAAKRFVTVRESEKPHELLGYLKIVEQFEDLATAKTILAMHERTERAERKVEMRALVHSQEYETLRQVITGLEYEKAELKTLVEEARKDCADEIDKRRKLKFENAALKEKS